MYEMLAISVIYNYDQQISMLIMSIWCNKFQNGNLVLWINSCLKQWHIIVILRPMCSVPFQKEMLQMLPKLYASNSMVKWIACGQQFKITRSTDLRINIRIHAQDPIKTSCKVISTLCRQPYLSFFSEYPSNLKYIDLSNSNIKVLNPLLYL